MKRELALLRRLVRHHLALLLAIAGGIGLLEVLLAYFGERIAAGPGFQAMLAEIMPREVQRLLVSEMGVVTLDGALAFGFQHPLVLVATIAFVVVAATVPAAERESGFLDLVLASPVSRGRYLAPVLALAAVGAVVFPVALLAGAAVGLALVVDDPSGTTWTTFLPAALLMTLLLLAVAGLTLLVVAGAERRGPVAGRVAALLFVLYWIDVLAFLWEPLERIERFSPFHWYRPVDAMRAGSTGVGAGAVLGGIFVVATVLAVVRFQRRDV